MPRSQWEGAELNFYINDESYSIPLSDMQFAVVGKLLGLKIETNGYACFSDATLEKFLNMDFNPLQLERK